MNKYLLLVLGTLGIISPGLFLSSASSSYGEIAVLLIVVTGIVAAFLSFNPFSRNWAKFLPTGISLVALIFSRGYLEAAASVPPLVLPAFVTDFVAVIGVSIVGILLLSGFESLRRMELAFAQSGHDDMDISVMSGSFTSIVLLVAVLSLFSAGLVYEAIKFLPQINVGLLPAVLVFLIIYLAVQTVIFRRKEEH